MRANWLLLAAGVLLLSGCKDDRWSGFGYPDRHNLSEHIATGTFDSLDACRTATVAALRKEIGRRNDSRIEHEGEITLADTDYECGLNCEADSSGLNACEETKR